MENDGDKVLKNAGLVSKFPNPDSPITEGIVSCLLCFGDVDAKITSHCKCGHQVTIFHRVVWKRRSYFTLHILYVSPKKISCTHLEYLKKGLKKKKYLNENVPPPSALTPKKEGRFL